MSCDKDAHASHVVCQALSRKALEGTVSCLGRTKCKQTKQMMCCGEAPQSSKVHRCGHLSFLCNAGLKSRNEKA